MANAVLFLLTDHKNGLTNERMEWIGYNNIERQIPGIMALLPTRVPRIGHCWLRSLKTCKLNGVSAEHWLSDVLAKLVNGWPAVRLDELLPWSSTYTMHAHHPRLAA